MERSPCVNQDTCRLRDSPLGCREDVHHRIWPRNQYQSGVAKEYRDLEINKVRICRAQHNDIHATERPPQKLSNAEMREVVLLSRIAESAIKESYEQATVDGGRPIPSVKRQFVGTNTEIPTI